MYIHFSDIVQEYFYISYFISLLSIMLNVWPLNLSSALTNPKSQLSQVIQFKW